MVVLFVFGFFSVVVFFVRFICDVIIRVFSHSILLTIVKRFILKKKIGSFFWSWRSHI